MVKEDVVGLTALKSALADQLGQQRFQLWFGPPTQLTLRGSRLIVRVANTFLRDWIRKNVQRDIETCAAEVLARELMVAYEIDGALLLTAARTSRSRSESADSQAVDGESPVEFESSAPEVLAFETAKSKQGTAGLPATQGANATVFCAKAPPRCNPSDAMTLETLAVGKSNQFAANSAQMLANGLHQAGLVLFFGPTGVGKTHLLRAIRRHYLKSFAKRRAVYLTAEQFTGGFVDAVRGTGLPSFRQKCRGADIFLLDDIHFLANKRATLEEFLHTIDSISAAGHQLVLSSDRPLGQLHMLGAEVVSRLAGGMTCEMEPPNFEMRIEILRLHCQRLRLSLSEDVLRSIATCITPGARELLGALHRLQLVSVTEHRPIDVPLVEEALRVLAQQNVQTVRLGDIQRAVCEVFGVEAAGLRSESKTRSLSEPRMVAMWLARKYTRAPWSEIGDFFGRRSHSTVISAHRRVERLVGKEGTVRVADSSCSVEDAIRRVEQVLRRA